MTEKCQCCKRLLDDPKDPTTEDCGGDCLRCMGEIFEDPDCIIAMLNIRIEAQAAEIAILRQPHTDAQHDQLLQECLVKLRDVQGTQAPKQYACNLIKRIERVLQGQING